jgi:hypothetical protein
MFFPMYIFHMDVLNCIYMSTKKDFEQFSAAYEKKENGEMKSLAKKGKSNF